MHIISLVFLGSCLKHKYALCKIGPVTGCHYVKIREALFIFCQFFISKAIRLQNNVVFNVFSIFFVCYCLVAFQNTTSYDINLCYVRRGPEFWVVYFCEIVH